MVTNKSKRYFFLPSYTLCLCWMHWFVSHLIYFCLTKPIMQQCFHPSTKYLLCEYIAPSFVRHSFRVRGELGTFSPIHLCAFWFKSQIYFCVVMQVELLEWKFWHGAVLEVGPGSGLSLSKYFGPISGLHKKLFYSIKSNVCFLSWRRFVLLTAVTSVSEAIVICLHVILFEITTAFFYSLLGLVSHCF